MAADAFHDSPGPSSSPPRVPEGWLAQWEGPSRRWYFVQRATGEARWEVPTEPVILTPSTTPTSVGTGPSKAPNSRPQTNSPPTGILSGGTPGNRNYVATDKAGFSSFFSSPGNSSQQGGPTQMATSMLSRLSNQLLHDKPGGANPSVPPVHQGHGPFGSNSQYQNGQQQPNTFAYTSTAQPGTYATSTPQYHQPSGQFSSGLYLVSEAQGNTLTGASQLGGMVPQNYSIDTHGHLSPQFMAPSTLSQHYPVAQLPPAGLSDQFQAVVTSAAMPSGLVTNPASSTTQLWQVGAQQLPISQGPKSEMASTGPSVVNMGVLPALAGYPQQTQQNPSTSLPITPFTSSQYSSKPALDSFGHSGALVSHQGDFLGQSTSSGQSTQVISHSLYESPASLGFPGQPGQHPIASSYGASPPYQPYLTGLQQQAGPSFTAGGLAMSTSPGIGSSFTSSQSTGTVPFRSHISSGVQQSSHFSQHSTPPLSAAFGAHPQLGSAPNHQFNTPGFVVELQDSHVDPSKFQRTPTDAIGQFSGNDIQPMVTLQAPVQQPHATAGQWASLNPGQQRPGLSDPQFVSGPWASIHGVGTSYPPTSRYNGL